MPKPAGTTPHATAAPWRSFVVACRKCSKRLDGGFGPDGDEKLGRAVKRALRQVGRRGALHVVETGCLGLCPKGAVAVLRADRPAELRAVPAGMNGRALLEEVGGWPADPPDAGQDRPARAPLPTLPGS